MENAENVKIDVNIQNNIQNLQNIESFSQITLRISPELKEFFSKIAKSKGLTLNALLNLILNSLKSGSLLSDIFNFLK